MKNLLFLFTLLITLPSLGQTEKPVDRFWTDLESHCGKAYEGTVIEAPENDDFRGKKLIMHVRSCESNIIRIPFFVGEDRSRTWVLTRSNDGLELKHDHRHMDGSKDEVTNYGGITPNVGRENVQIFPADEETADLLPEAATNVWWITLEEDSFTYNLKRIGTDRLFKVRFDLSTPVATPEAPWGWED